MSLGGVAAPSVASDPTTKVNLTAGQRKRIKQYLKRSRMNPRHSQLNLEGYLLLPVQRIPRYRLLVSVLSPRLPGNLSIVWLMMRHVARGSHAEHATARLLR